MSGASEVAGIFEQPELEARAMVGKNLWDLPDYL